MKETNTEFPTCPQCLQVQICEWMIHFENNAAEVVCENCGATYRCVRRPFWYVNTLTREGTT